jgi:hypothetical protein
MKLKDYARGVKVKGNKVTLPIAGYSLSIEVNGKGKSRGVKVGAVVVSAILALVGIY